MLVRFILLRVYGHFCSHEFLLLMFVCTGQPGCGLFILLRNFDGHLFVWWLWAFSFVFKFLMDICLYGYPIERRSHSHLFDSFSSTTTFYRSICHFGLAFETGSILVLAGVLCNISYGTRSPFGLYVVWIIYMAS